MRWVGHVARMRENINTHRVLVKKLEVRFRSRWEDMKTKFKEIGCEGVKLIDLAQDTNK
jgi:hypothetical protein